jgi:nicotinamidase-related amidase
MSDKAWTGRAKHRAWSTKSSKAKRLFKVGGHALANHAKTALLILDFQVGIGDQAFAEKATKKAVQAVEAARTAGIGVFFTKVAFRAGYPEVAPANGTFAAIASRKVLGPGNSRLLPELKVSRDDYVFDKKRFSAFSGNDLQVVLRSQQITQLVLAGVASSGVVLSTVCTASDEDYVVSVLADACADPDAALNDALIKGLGSRCSEVLTVDEWCNRLLSF